MVQAMQEEPQCVCDLRGRVGLDMSTVSKHLSVLKHAGVISGEKRGTWVYYSLKTPCVIQFLACLDQVLPGNEGN